MKNSEPPKLQESSASGHLKGLKYKGKTVDAVWREGDGAKRLITFSDGTVERTDKRGIATLARVKGTLDQLAKYRGASPTERKKMLDKSRELQRKSQKDTVEKLVNSLMRARTGKSKKQLHKQVTEVLEYPAESPLTGHPSVVEALRGKGRHAEMVKHIDGIESVRWVTIRRGNRLVHFPVKGKKQ